MNSFLYSHDPNFPPSPYTYVLTPQNPSIGIEEVRDLHRFLALPADPNHPKKAVIISAHQLTIPAQNALLKVLEEPPPNTQIFLVTTYPDLLLPTVLSRVVQKKSSIPESLPDLANAEKALATLTSPDLAERLLFLDSLQLTRETALKLLDELEYLLHSQISSKNYVNPALYDHLVQTKIYLQANCNTRLTLNHLALNF